MKMPTDKTPKIYLSRRNLEALLSKLDRNAAGDISFCAIVKLQSTSPEYRQTMRTVMVIAVEDEPYYLALGRPAGEMHPEDESRLKAPSTGLSPQDEL